MESHFPSSLFVTSKWVYNVKTGGSPKRYKAHRVARGFQQNMAMTTMAECHAMTWS